MAMQQWQKAINDTVKTHVTNIARELKKGYPDVQFSLNYRVHYPNGFTPGEDAIIPITLPSAKHGPFHIADAIVSVGMDSKIVDIGLKPMETARPFDSSEHAFEVRERTFGSTMDRFTGFAEDINNILFSPAMQTLLTPKLGGASLDTGCGAGNIIRADGTRGMMALGQGRTVPITGTKGPVAWSKVKSSKLVAEEAKAKTIRTKEEQQAFMEDALDKASKAPHWYTALGGKQQENLKEKIVDIYMQTCAQEKRTLLPLLFFDKLTESMLQRGQISPYCERSNDYVDGTADGRCMQGSCPVYDQNCPKLSARLGRIK